MELNNFQALREKFDKIFLLTMSNRQDRTHAVLEQLSQIGMFMPLEESGIEIHYGTPFPFNDIIANAFNATGKGRFSKPNEYDCSRNHYGIIKQAYDLGYEHILIIEDDIRFIKDKSIFKEYIENIPNDYDIIQFGGFTVDPKIDKYLKPYSQNYYNKHKDVGVWNCSMYALSRKGMEYYLAFMNKIFWVADGPLYKAPLNDKLINTYISSIPIVIQADKDQVASDIRTEENDKIDYKTWNRYENFIDKTNYLEY